MRKILNSKFKIGDLVHVPSETVLYKASKFVKLKKPRKLLIVDQKLDEYKVFYEGQEWCISTSDIYQ